MSRDISLPELVASYADLLDPFYGRHRVRSDPTTEFPSNLLYALLHLDVQAAFIKETKDYHPTLEIEMILNLIRSVPPSWVTLADASRLIGYLITLSDILIQRIKKEESPALYAKISAVLKPLDNTVFERLIDSKESPTAQFIQTKLAKTFASTTHPKKGVPAELLPLEDSSTPVEPLKFITDFNAALDQKISSAQTRQRAKEIGNEAKLFFTDKPTEVTLTEKFSEKQSLLASLIFYYIGSSKNCHFLNLIRGLQNQFSDKKKFALICFNNFQAVVVQFHKMEMTADLYYFYFKILEEAMFKLLIILDKPLKPGELREIIQADHAHSPPPLYSLYGFNRPAPLDLYHIFDGNFRSWDLFALIQGKIIPCSDNITDLRSFIKYASLSKQTIQNSFKILGREINYPENKSLPLAHMVFVECTQAVSKALGELVTQFVAVNAKAPAAQQRDVIIFFTKHQQVISLLIKIMGTNAVDGMKACIGANVLPLEEKLSNLAKVDAVLTEFLIKHFKPYSSSFEGVTDRLTTLNILTKILIKAEAAGYSKKDDNKLSDYLSFEEFLQALKIKILSAWSGPVLITSREETAKAFCELVLKFVKANAQAPVYQQRDYLDFFKIHHQVISVLISIMETKAIELMKARIGSTVLSLERMLSTFPKIDKELTQFMIEYLKPHTPGFETVTQCFIALYCAISVQVEQDDKTCDSPKQFYIKLAHKHKPEELLYVLRALLLKRLCKLDEINLNKEEIAKIFQRIPPEDFIKLVAASLTMQSDNYREVFLELLRRDLTAGDIDEFLHATGQDNSIGKNLARHNQAIRNKLREYKIIPEQALTYKKLYRFVIYPTDVDTKNNINNHYSVLWNYLQQLKKNMESDWKPEVCKQVDYLQDNLTTFLKDISKRTAFHRDRAAGIVEILATERTSKLKNIKKQCEACLKEKKALEQKSQTVLNRNIYEFIEHVNNQLTHIEQETQKIAEMKQTSPKDEKHKSKLEKRPQFITVKQWCKDDVRTFFLGDEVGCCLATDNAQFAAMVQRRMDDAMLFHVAIDEISGKPVALIWLYLAETHDKKIVLMANFFEVNAKFGSKPHLRKAILNGLLQFTQQFLQDNPSITQFYMSRLSYGQNVGDLDGYALMPLSLQDKLGGPYLVPGQDEEDDEEEAYYLDSLQEKEFHRFDPETLAKETSSSARTVTQIIQTAVFELARSEKNMDKIIQEVINQRQFELSHFFSEPLEKNADVINMITATWAAYTSQTAATTTTTTTTLTTTSTVSSLLPPGTPRSLLFPSLPQEYKPFEPKQKAQDRTRSLINLGSPL